MASETQFIRPLSLRQNFSWTLFGNVVYAGCQWCMIVVLAKLTSPEMVGRFALGLAVTAPVIMLANLQLRGVQATDARGEYAFGEYLALRWVTTAIALAVIIGFAAFGPYPRETAWVIVAVGLAKAFESLSDVYYGLMQRHERLDRIARSMLIKGPLSLCAMTAAVWWRGDVLWGSVALACSWALVLAAYDIPSAEAVSRSFEERTQTPYGSSGENSTHLLPTFRLSRLVALARLALPLGLVMGLISLNSNIPRYFVESYGGERELGIFAALAYLLVAGNTVVASLGQSAAPRLANLYAAGELPSFQRLLWHLTGIGLGMGFSGIALAAGIGRPLLAVLYGPEYARQVDVLLWLAAAGGMAFTASYLGYGMTAARRFNVQFPLFLCVTATTALAARLLVPTKGAAGAAQALLAGSFVQVLGSAAVVIQALRTKSQEKF